ncbi:MAG: hypothetical protein DRR08_06905 [Candidatus Parabeggiatoa sp. nov. 2]|nr:MAG: hypothetical protein B6247_01155 [Beggiatoa sp. 4572_84]RKZ62132.1 MAG: hypothetical protein DRR08_06905 [Gammaproteobacteria bacterium]
MKTHEEMVAEWMKEPQFKAAYDALEEEFVLFASIGTGTRCGWVHARRGSATYKYKNTRSCQTRICGG